MVLLGDEKRGTGVGGRPKCDMEADHRGLLHNNGCAYGKHVTKKGDPPLLTSQWERRTDNSLSLT